MNKETPEELAINKWKDIGSECSCLSSLKESDMTGEMTRQEFDIALQKIDNPSERKYFHQWYVQLQDSISWDAFKARGYQDIKDVVNDVICHVTKSTGKPEQLKLAFMPTAMARTSPFYPMSRADMKTRPLYKDFEIKNRWGSITITGPKLSIQDESVLLSILVLVKKHKNEVIKTDYAELCENMGVNRGSNQYSAISDCLKRLTKTVVDTNLYSTKNGEGQKIIRSITGAMISNVDQVPESTKVIIYMNPYFVALYGANLTTGIDLDKRAKIKGDVAKALYRFLETHTGSGVPFGLMTLCHAINVNVEQQIYEIRKVIRKALSELQKQGHVKRWKIDRNDLIYIFR